MDENSAVIEKGGRGGYSRGIITIYNTSEFYIFIGSSKGYNGGGKPGNGSLCPLGGNSGHGGGATDIRTIDGDWNSTESLQSRIIVAGGGGGFGGPLACRYGTSKGTNGGSGNPVYPRDFLIRVGTFPAGSGGFGFEGSSPGQGTAPADIRWQQYQKGFDGMNGTFGIGGQGGSLYDYPPDNLDESNPPRYGPSTGGGGGGGYYGGGGGGAGAGFWGSQGGSGGGGSGFISSLFSMGKMISGSSPMPSYTSSYPVYGNEGHGACRISIYHPLPTCRQIFYLSQNIYSYLFVFVFLESD